MQSDTHDAGGVTMTVLALERCSDVLRNPPSRLARVLRLPWLRTLGPAFAVSIGYVDPGNWATDLAAGTFGYRLIWVVIVANAIALVLQVAVSELAVASETDFGTAIARRWPRLKTPLLFTFGGAAIATDVAEFAGIVLGLQLLLHLSTVVAVAAGIAIVFAILRASDGLTKGLEIVSICALAGIASACFAELPALHPLLGSIARGATVPTIPGGSIVILVGIIGATVMPHNLFLHSVLVRRAADARPVGEGTALGRFFRRETFAALNIAAVVNVALIVIGAAIGGTNGSLQYAFDTLERAGGSGALLFGGGLLLSGIAASTTATAAGDAIFATFSRKRMSRFVRRALTLSPAAVLLVAGCNIGTMLVWSQVALALVLPVALVPLVLLLIAHRRSIRHGVGIACAATVTSVVCIGFDAVMVAQVL